MFAKTKRFLSRASRLRALETAFGLLKDLSPDQVKTFDEVVRRRPLFYGGKRPEEEVIKMAEASLNETPVRKAVTQLQEKITDLETNFKTLEGRLKWVLSPELPKKIDSEDPEDSVMPIIDWSEAMKEERLSTLLDMLVGCINKLEVLKKRTRSLLKRLQV